MKIRSTRSGLVMMGGLAALAFVLSASRVARSTTTVYRTVSVGSCSHVTDERPDLNVGPGWMCGLPGGSDNNGAAISGQLQAAYFDYELFNSMPMVEVCVTKVTYNGAIYADCATPGQPATFPGTMDVYLALNNVKQNASVWDYVRADFSVWNDRLYPDYAPIDFRAFGVGFVSAY